jgi:hypothetical protein
MVATTPAVTALLGVCSVVTAAAVLRRLCRSKAQNISGLTDLKAGYV